MPNFVGHNLWHPGLQRLEIRELEVESLHLVKCSQLCELKD